VFVSLQTAYEYGLQTLTPECEAHCKQSYGKDSMDTPFDTGYVISVGLGFNFNEYISIQTGADWFINKFEAVLRKDTTAQLLSLEYSFINFPVLFQGLLYPSDNFQIGAIVGGYYSMGLNLSQETESGFGLEGGIVMKILAPNDMRFILRMEYLMDLFPKITMTAHDVFKYNGIKVTLGYCFDFGDY
jgi:hypothetical protein